MVNEKVHCKKFTDRRDRYDLSAHISWCNAAWMGVQDAINRALSLIPGFKKAMRRMNGGVIEKKEYGRSDDVRGWASTMSVGRGWCGPHHNTAMLLQLHMWNYHLPRFGRSKVPKFEQRESIVYEFHLLHGCYA